MTLVLETGAGVRNANSYATAAYVTAYLTARGREEENTWSSRTTAVQEQAAIKATDYIEKRWGQKFAGFPRFTFADVYATGEIAVDSNPSADETLTVGQTTYTFKSALTGEEDEILIGASASTTATNIAAAINASTDDEGTLFGEDTALNRDASASVDSVLVTLTARAPGVSGDDTTLTTDAGNLTLTTFTGGQDGGQQPLAFPRLYLYDAQGNSVTTIPRGLKDAVAEYAVRSLAATLAPDPTVDASGGSVKRKREKVGPIEEETEYVEGTFLTLKFSPYPAADELLRQYLKTSSGGVIR